MKKLSVIRRVLCSFLAAAMLVTVSGCSSFSKNVKGGLNSSKTITNYFKPTELDIASRLQYVQNIKRTDDAVYFSGIANTSGAELVMGIYDTEAKKFTEINMSEIKTDYPMDAFLYDDLVYFSYADEEYKTHLSVIDSKTGNVENDIAFNADVFISGIYKDKAGNICIASISYAAVGMSTVMNVYDKNTLESKETINLNKKIGLKEDQVIARLSAGNDGTLTALVVTEGDEENLSLYKLSYDYKVLNVVENVMADMKGNISNVYFKENGDFGLMTLDYDEDTDEVTYFVNEIDLMTGEVKQRFEPEFDEGKNFYPFVSVGESNLIYIENNKFKGYNIAEGKEIDLIDIETEAGKKFMNPYTVSANKNSLVLLNLYYGEESGRDLTYRYDIQTEETSSVKVPETEYGCTLIDVVDGKYYYLERSYETDTVKSYIYIADQDGNISEKICVKIDSLGKNMYPSSFVISDGSIMAAVSGYDEATQKVLANIVKFDMNGEIISQIDIDDVSYIDSLYSLSSGVYVSYRSDKGYYSFAKIDTENSSLGDSMEISSNSRGFVEGDDKYDLYYFTTEGVYGYSLSEKKETEIINWVDSDLSIEVRSLSVINDNQIIVDCDDMNTSQREIYVLNRVDDETLKIIQNKQIITAAGTGISSGDVRNRIIDFNKSSDKYRIQINDYEKYSVYDESEDNPKYISGSEKLNTDMAAGDVPDIILGDSEIDMDMYASKGILTDLNSYINKDSDISKSDYFENIFDLYSTNGKLYQIVTSFNIAALTGIESELGEGTDWSFDDFFSIADKNTMFYIISRDDLTRNMITNNLSEFIDFSKRKCDFNNDNFIKLIELIKKEGLTNEEMNDIFYGDKMDESWYMEYQNRFNDKKCMTEFVEIGDFMDIASYQQGTIKGTAALKGIPSEKQSGIIIDADNTISISARSKVKDGAWEFVKSFIMEDFQDSLTENYSYTFPVRKSSMDKLLDKALMSSDNTYTTETGEALNPLDRATGEKMISLIGESSRKVVTNSSVSKIITNELEKFYSDGCSAEEAAANIQNAVSIYLVETK